MFNFNESTGEFDGVSPNQKVLAKELFGWGLIRVTIHGEIGNAVVGYPGAIVKVLPSTNPTTLSNASSDNVRILLFTVLSSPIFS